MLCNLAHELVHFWYGILVGLVDWNEEWLSEGGGSPPVMY